MKLKHQLVFDYYVGGAVHALLKPLVFVLGKILHRNHSLEGLEEITIIKMIGGGSLVIAYPALFSLKRKSPTPRLILVTTPSIKPFAEAIGIFDELVIIRNDHPAHLAVDSVKAISRVWRSRALVDLEIHSRLSSIFSLLTCAINRIGIYTEISFWRRSLYTHLLFYNKFSPIYSLYDQVSYLLGSGPVDFSSAQDQFKARVARTVTPISSPGKVQIGVAPGCSDLSKERMLTPELWKGLLIKRCSGEAAATLHFIGAGQDRKLAEEIIASINADFPTVECLNWCGSYSLSQSIAAISQLDVLYCIDSSLIHFARLLGIKTISYWGPTDPRIMLRPDACVQEETHYVKLSCSPCVHIASEPPCYGNNICMNAAVQSENYQGERNPRWLAKG